MPSADDPSSGAKYAIRLANNVWRVFCSLQGFNRSVWFLHNKNKDLMATQSASPTLHSKLSLDSTRTISRLSFVMVPLLTWQCALRNFAKLASTKRLVYWPSPCCVGSSQLCWIALNVPLPLMPLCKTRPWTMPWSDSGSQCFLASMTLSWMAKIWKFGGCRTHPNILFRKNLTSYATARSTPCFQPSKLMVRLILWNSGTPSVKSFSSLSSRFWNRAKTYHGSALRRIWASGCQQPWSKHLGTSLIYIHSTLTYWSVSWKAY